MAKPVDLIEAINLTDVLHRKSQAVWINSLEKLKCKNPVMHAQVVALSRSAPLWLIPSERNRKLCPLFPATANTRQKCISHLLASGFKDLGKAMQKYERKNRCKPSRIIVGLIKAKAMMSGLGDDAIAYRICGRLADDSSYFITCDIAQVTDNVAADQIVIV